MTEELRERREKIGTMIDRAPLDSQELHILRMHKADCFHDLVSEVERLEAENERLEKERKLIAWHWRNLVAARGTENEEAESEAFWAMRDLLQAGER